MRANEFTTGYGFGFVRYFFETTDPDQMTARMAGPMMLPVELLARFAKKAPSPEMVEKAKENGFSSEEDPIVFAVTADNRPKIISGQATVTAAEQAGVDYLHAEVRWYGGSDQNRDNTYCPAAISRVAHWG